MSTDGVKFESSDQGEPELKMVAADRRPSTPHPTSRSGDVHENFHFDDVDDRLELDERSTKENHESCIGISLDTVLSTLKGDSSDHRAPATIGSTDQRGFFTSFKAMVQKTLSPLNWVEGGRTPRTPADSALDDYDLMNRLPSWKTLESPSVHRLKQDSSQQKTTSSKQVQFQYPPITSIRLRPRTESDEIDQLYFAPDELDQIEDDRSATKAADDIETLCVIANPSEDMDSVPGITESLDANPSDEDPSDSSLIGRKSSSSPSNGPPEKEKKKKKRGIVRGVQILLREKSLG